MCVELYGFPEARLPSQIFAVFSIFKALQEVDHLYMRASTNTYGTLLERLWNYNVILGVHDPLCTGGLLSVPALSRLLGILSTRIDLGQPLTGYMQHRYGQKERHVIHTVNPPVLLLLLLP